MENSNLEYRAYFLSMRNIGLIDKGIQPLHAIVEYAQQYFHDDIYQEWAKNHKTVIILDGGTSKDMTSNSVELMRLNHNHAVFNEPDLNDSLSAIAFIVDETVYDRKKYPISLPFSYGEIKDITNLKDLVSKIQTFCSFSNTEIIPQDMENINFLGLDKIKLRAFLNQFGLAR